MLSSIAAIALGASLGALLRWVFAGLWNHLLPQLPLGTLASNLLGGYAIGAAVAWLTVRTDLPPEVRLFVITGFLGGLTTFSTFSAEVVLRLQEGEFGWAFLVAGTHLFGSLVLTALGMATVHWVRNIKLWL